jgi:hypothetical protein
LKVSNTLWHWDLENLPRSCLFIFDIEACSALIFQNVDGAKQKFNDIKVKTFPGENISDFATEAQRLIKIIQSD